MGAQLRLPRPRLLTVERRERIHDAARRILETGGLRVRLPEVVEAAARLGYAVRDDRVLIPGAVADDFVTQTRAQGGKAPQDPAEPSPEILLAPCQYAIAVHDLDSDEIVPFTAHRLVEASKLLDTLHPFGVIGKAPGTPVDVPPDLQPIMKYRVQALHCRHGQRPVELGTPRATPYLLDMAEALGHPITSADVYVVSPLTVGGESLECALAYRGRLRRVWVSNMSSLGATAPIRPGDALAVGAAEVIGAAILVREATGLPVDWSIRVCPFDPRAMALTLGAPEEFALALASDELNAWYHGRGPGVPWGSLHTQAKLPDQQSAAERLTLMLLPALMGTRVFGGIGRMSLDEVFSAEQAVIDVELRDHVQRLLADPEVDCDPEACLAEAAAGAEGGFLGLDSTAHSYRATYWWPRLFHRGMLAEWQAAGASELRARAKEMVRRQLRQYDFEPAPDLRREVERIYARAARDLSA